MFIKFIYISGFILVCVDDDDFTWREATKEFDTFVV